MNKKTFIPISVGILFSLLIVLMGYLFVDTTQDKTMKAQNKIVSIHNQISLLPQPENIDLGVPSGSIQGQLNNYRSARDEYTQLSFGAPSHARNKSANLLTLDMISKPSVKPSNLANSYTKFINNYTQTLENLEKTLTYNPNVDLQGLEPSEDEFKQRVQNARTGFMNARSAIQQAQLPEEDKNQLSQELTTLIEASVDVNDTSSWSKEVKTSQKNLRDTLQSYWEAQLSKLSVDKQKLVNYYSNIYQ